jgi:hypothetical protein
MAADCPEASSTIEPEHPTASHTQSEPKANFPAGGLS